MGKACRYAGPTIAPGRVFRLNGPHAAPKHPHKERYPHGQASPHRHHRPRSGSRREILRGCLRHETRRHGPARHLHVGRHRQCGAAQEGDREGENRHLPLRHVGRRPRRGREEGRRRGRDLSGRPADLGELLLRGEIPRPARHRVRSHPQGLGRRRQGRGAQALIAPMSDAAQRVIAIGAGPVGLSLALRLAQQGISVCVVEALGEDNFLEQVPRAGTNHPATLELFDGIGLYDRLAPRGIVAPLFHYGDRHDNKLIAEFDHVHLKEDTRFPYVLQCERIKIVEEALALARAHPLIDVRLSTSFTGFAQTADRVTAHVTGPSGEPETITGAYLVSGEGARSIVRRDLGIEFEGFTYSDRTLNIEVAYDFRRHGYTERNYISDPDKWANLFHWKGPPDRWRVHFPVESDAQEAALTRPDAMQARLQRFLPTGKAFDIVGSNLYVVHQRVAKKFRAGRAILAGDCAHVNSPIGAMGMNSGIHDAFNLAEKLTKILRREAGEEVLDRYERQRRHVALQHTQAQTVRNKRLLAEKDPAIREPNHSELRRTATDPKLT